MSNASAAEFYGAAKLWLGDVPKDWNIKPIKFVATYNDEKLSETTDPAYEMQYVDISSVSLGEGVQNYEVTNFEAAPSRARRIAREGDVIVSTVRTYLKAITRLVDVPENLVVSTGFIVLRAGEQIVPEFLGYFAESEPFVNATVAQSVGVSYPAINAGDIVRFPIVYPERNAQLKISKYLDRKTGEVDELIAKKEELLGFLSEKRSAIITKSVTQGLNPNSHTKQSGIEWLGNIPESWEALRLRFVGRAQNGINIGGEFFGKGYPFVSYSDVFYNPELPRAVAGLVESTDDDRKRYSVKEGDIFFTRTSETIEEIAFSSVCMETIEEATFAGFLIRVRPMGDSILPEYAKYYFRNSKLRAFFVKEMNLVTRASLSQTLLGNVPVLIPPKDEQKQIAEYLDQQMNLLSETEEKLKQAIELLVEYRSALITSAVTGQIEVTE